MVSSKPFFLAASSLLLPVGINAAAEDFFGPANATLSRYWDCCKPSCAWENHGILKNLAVKYCDAKNAPLGQDDGIKQNVSGCDEDGKAHICANQSPWAVSEELSYGFVGAFLKDGLETEWCCGCYELTFPGVRALEGKRMIVQSTNTMYDDTTKNGFTLSIPGGNYTESPACNRQFAAQGVKPFGNRAGFTSRSDCNLLPEAYRDGCKWRFDWFSNANVPQVSYKRVKCPKELTDITGCVKQDDDTFASESDSAAGPAQNKVPFSTFSIALSVVGTGLLAFFAQGFFY